MDEIVFVEILNRHNRVKNRVRLDHFPASIGTAYTNDVILDDRYASPKEARIELSELSEPILRNSGSVNGIHKRHDGKVVESEKLKSGDIFRIGHTHVRIMFASHEMPEPIAIKAGVLEVSEWANNFFILLGIFLVGFATLIADEYSGQVGNFSKTEFYEAVISAGVGLLFVSGIWAAGTRLVSHEFRLFQHLAVLSFFVVTGIIIDLATGYVDFVFSPDAYLKGISLFLYCLLGVAWLFTHLCVVSNQALRIKALSSIMLVGIIFGMVQLGESVNEEFNTGALKFSNTIKPHGLGLVSFTTADELFSNAQSLKEKLEMDMEK